jgi:hypothetical protein
MSNIFQDSVSNLRELDNRLIGPDYDYAKHIRNPEQLGMSSKGDISTLTKDVTGLINYVRVLVTGEGKASTTGNPLGNKFFLRTGAKCKDKGSGREVQRYIYINNVPDGSMPFITSGMGVKFTSFKGLVPGTMTNVSRISPNEILQSFSSAVMPECQAVTLETIDVNNKKGSDTQFITTVDIENMPPCWFPNKKNPVTGEKCREGFSSINDEELNMSSKMPDDIIIKMYLSTLGIFGVYLIVKLLQNRKLN